MKILALDSTADIASVAICENESLIASTTVSAGLTHSELLLPMIEELLGHSKLSCADIELFAAAKGPGSFTGVRIGAATVKGLAFGRNVPCVGVSTLEALAYNLAASDGIICPVMNARRDQVYNAIFEACDGTLRRLCPDRALAIDDLGKELASYKGKKIYLCGDGARLVREKLPDITFSFVPDYMVLQNAYSVAQTALALYRSGVSTTDSELTPTYLRLPQAERERLEKISTERK